MRPDQPAKVIWCSVSCGTAVRPRNGCRYPVGAGTVLGTGEVPRTRGRQASVGRAPDGWHSGQKSRKDVMGIKPFCPTHTMCACRSPPLGRGDILGLLIFQHADDIEIHLSRWAVILRALHGKGVILSADANAKGELWHSPTTNARGDKLTEFVLAHDLHVANQAGQPSTFVSIPVAPSQT
ncbi:hypothetical protein PR048_033785 [Dryococelus australis]|uniref:Endonuclease/exonuclease/phosphatase domain-containing protein n=1 Tax=Dryococelus australis TaxID=614101 RepID=A0ABQ9G381_9NEOP|nr:hypothetical protein PR048_033785 [Dryococelus australis]